jgi:hypothetical protein
MAKNAALIWLISIAGFSLLAAVAVYLFARIYPPGLLESSQATYPILASHTSLFGNAPSFFYTLSIGLLVGACAPALTGARLHCLSWISVAMLLELSQFPTLAKPISIWLATVLSEPGWEVVRPYWSRGVFDPLDLLATLVGGYFALVLLSHLPRVNADASTS